MNRSLWMAEGALPMFAPLVEDTAADVAIVGGGIAGVTCATLLQRAGRTVVLIDSGRIGHAETGRTTAHLTELLDARYHVLESKFGKDGARLAAGSSRAAIDRIEAFVHELGIDCGFERVPGTLYAETREEREELEKEFESLGRVGAEVDWAPGLPLPIETTGALRVGRQAQIHPLEYLRALTAAFVAQGGRVFEGTRMLELEDGAPCRVMTTNGTVTAHDVLVLTHVPLSTRFAIHTKIAAYRSYVLAARWERPFPVGLFFDMREPYHYVRAHSGRSGKFLIVGGEDHKTGQNDDTRSAFSRLREYVQVNFGSPEIAHSWSGQIIEPADGLPFIGVSPGSEHLWVATGFSGTGITFGTVAAMILSDHILGIENPWADLYAASRVKPLAQAQKYVSENVDFPSHIAHDRLSRGDVERTEDVPRGEGRLVRSEGKMLAVHRDDSGGLHVLSAVCTHLGCHVRWNTAEGTWDCPCHGSRFDVDGAVVNGPATQGLEAEPGADDALTPRPATQGQEEARR